MLFTEMLIVAITLLVVLACGFVMGRHVYKQPSNGKHSTAAQRIFNEGWEAALNNHDAVVAAYKKHLKRVLNQPSRLMTITPKEKTPFNLPEISNRSSIFEDPWTERMSYDRTPPEFELKKNLPPNLPQQSRFQFPPDFKLDINLGDQPTKPLNKPEPPQDNEDKQ